MKRTSTVLASVVLVAGLSLVGLLEIVVDVGAGGLEDPPTLCLRIPRRPPGPDAISANGIRMNYRAAAAPGPAMVAYRTALGIRAGR